MEFAGKTLPEALLWGSYTTSVRRAYEHIRSTATQLVIARTARVGTRQNYAHLRFRRHVDAQFDRAVRKSTPLAR